MTPRIFGGVTVTLGSVSSRVDHSSTDFVELWSECDVVEIKFMYTFPNLQETNGFWLSWTNPQIGESHGEECHGTIQGERFNVQLVRDSHRSMNSLCSQWLAMIAWRLFFLKLPWSKNYKLFRNNDDHDKTCLIPYNDYPDLQRDEDTSITPTLNRKSPY